VKSRLFWKIFLPFWLLQTCIMLFLAYRVYSSFGPEHPWWLQPELRAMPILGHYATWRYNTQGEEELQDLFQAISLDQRSVYWLFDDQMNELSHTTLSVEAREAILRALEGNGTARSNGGTFVATPIADTFNRRFVFAAEFYPPPLLHSLPEGVLAAILISSLMTSLVCAVLAQYITRPILRLRDAAHSIAQGNLKARAGVEGSRRKDEIADLVRDFDAMAGEIADLVESNRRMLIGASHDLRSPIARIRVALSLAESAPEAERHELLERIASELVRLNELIGQILTVARLESGEIRHSLSPLSLNQIIGEAVEDARFEASQCNVEIAYDERWPEVTVSGEESMLRSAVENVLRNAIFYSGPEGRIAVSVAVSEGMAKIAVRDTGPGVPEEALAKLFRPFYRVDDARGRSTGGSGLGLSIVSGAIRAHHGSVRARNVQPHGLEILIELPLSAQPAPPHSTARLQA
jgi:two-component system, OmpR family, sensor histidine kinase CpxA